MGLVVMCPQSFDHVIYLKKIKMKKEYHAAWKQHAIGVNKMSFWMFLNEYQDLL